MYGRFRYGIKRSKLAAAKISGRCVSEEGLNTFWIGVPLLEYIIQVVIQNELQFVFR